jgi:hypothetical protein
VFEIVFDPGVKAHLMAIEVKYHGLIRAVITEQLEHDPGVETRNRKPLINPSVLSPARELRFGPGNRFRVFYRVDPDASQVRILAIGQKEGERLLIAGEIFDL